MSQPSRLLALLCCLALPHALSPPPSRARGGQEAKTSEALRQDIKRDKKDADAWHEYGEALAREGDSKGAAKAFREAVKLYTERYLNMHPTPASADAEAAARRRAELLDSLRRAPEAVERYLALEDDIKDFERSQLEALAGQVRMLRAEDDAHAAFFGSWLERKAQITSKPEPSFTEEARENRVNGAVRLRAVLMPDGKVGHVYVLRRLPDGLSERCVEAARRIKFKPAMKDGRPVAQFVMLEYNFLVF